MAQVKMNDVSVEPDKDISAAAPLLRDWARERGLKIIGYSDWGDDLRIRVTAIAEDVEGNMYNYTVKSPRDPNAIWENSWDRSELDFEETGVAEGFSLEWAK